MKTRTPKKLLHSRFLFFFLMRSLRILPFSCPPILSLALLPLFLFLIISFSLFPILREARAATYYVDATNGNDNNIGPKPETPWKTIAKVNASKFDPGDQIFFKRGEIWREQLIVPSSGLGGKPIIFGAYGTGDRPMINGADLIANNQNHWTNYSGHIYFTKIFWTTRSVYENGFILNQASSLKSMTEGSWYYSNGNLYVWTTDHSSPWTKNIEVPRRDCNIYIDRKSYIIVENFTLTMARNDQIYGKSFYVTNNSDYVTIQNCIISEGRGSHIHFNNGSDYGTVINCIVHTQQNPNNTTTATWVYGICFGNYGDPNSACLNATVINSIIYGMRKGINLQYIKGGKVSNNTIYDCSESGMYIGGASSAITIEQNVVHNVAKNYSSSGIGIGGSTYDNVNNCILRYNNIYNVNQVDIDGNGIILDIGSHHNDVYCNLIYSVDGAGILSYQSYNNNIYYNLIINTGNGSNFTYKSGIIISASHDINIYNNTIYNPRDIGIKLIGYSNDKSTFNVNFKNNIIFNSIIWTINVANKYSTNGHSFDYNNYYFTSGKMAYWNEIEYDTLEKYSKAQSQDANSITKNPLFIDADSKIFYLRSSSPLIDAGTDVGLKKDYANIPVPQGPRIDIGAFEYFENKVISPPKYLRVSPP